MHDNDAKPHWQIKILYDGACPFCRRTIEFFQNRNHRGLLAFQDIACASFVPSDYGTTWRELNRTVHAIRPDRSLIMGMDVFRHAYSAIGLGWLAAPTGWPILRPCFDIAYRFFSRYRVPLSRLLGGYGIPHDDDCNCR